MFVVCACDSAKGSPVQSACRSTQLRRGPVPPLLLDARAVSPPGHLGYVTVCGEITKLYVDGVFFGQGTASAATS